MATRVERAERDELICSLREQGLSLAAIADRVGLKKSMVGRIVERRWPPNDADLPGERWLSVVRYEGLYEVSSVGRVRAVHGRNRRIGRILKSHRNDKTYNGHSLGLIGHDGKRRTEFVAVLVLTAFVGPGLPGQICRHLDDDREHNYPSNLAWGSDQDNKDDALKNDRIAHGVASGMAKLNPEKVREIRGFLAAGETLVATAERYGVSFAAIWNIKVGRTWRRVA